MNGYVADYDPTTGDDPTVRLQIVPDCDPDLSFLDQDIFADVRDQEYQRASNDGVWGIVGEFWDGETWQHADSVWGFIGDDWRNSGYDTDVMAATIDAYRAQRHCPSCGGPIRTNQTH